MKKHLLVTGSLLLSSALSFGAGYQLNLQGLRQLAMGGSGTAIPWDVSTIFYNPGGLSRIDHLQVSASALAIMPQATYVQSPGVYHADAHKQTFVPFNVYIGAPVAYKSPVSVGVGVYTPFGNGIRWDDDWAGRYLVQEVNLRTVFIQPTVSYRVSDALSIGAGIIYATGNVDYRRAMPFKNAAGEDGSAHLEGSGNGWGFNLGIHWDISEQVQMGFSYRSQVNMNVDRGYAQFDVPGVIADSFRYSAFSSSLPMPQVFNVGIGIKATEALTLQADVNVVGWSAFKELAFDFEENSELLPDSHSPRKNRTSFALRAGANYDFSDRFAGMLGAAWDVSPVRDNFVTPDLPDANRGILTGGLHYRPFEWLSVTGVVEFVATPARKASFEAENFGGIYRTSAFTPGLGITLDF